MAVFDIQGHRGARAVRPENTLPSFEAALDAGVTSIETDVHLTRDGVPILAHDAVLPASASAAPHTPAARVRELSFAELRHWRVDRNPDPVRFPRQKSDVPPLTGSFAVAYGMDAYAPPAVSDLITFIEAYAGEAGRAAGKADDQRQAAARLRLDLELKRTPGRPIEAGDDFDGEAPGLLERAVVSVLRQAGWCARASVRSFDHRSVRAVRRLEPRIAGAVLVSATAPADPAAVAQAAEATTYCPEIAVLDRPLVEACHAAGIRVLPWTVNEPDDWERLVAWGVDGMTTDDPQALAEWLRGQGFRRD